ncbi:hypothetical protein, partial [Nitrospira sp. BLG_2]|uniref:hypothetical protein n=1 Tax=Nitrospira sp. BLG_2 TaxID=3397507 RepID=UPI003B9DBFCE
SVTSGRPLTGLVAQPYCATGIADSISAKTSENGKPTGRRLARDGLYDFFMNASQVAQGISHSTRKAK